VIVFLIVSAACTDIHTISAMALLSTEAGHPRKTAAQAPLSRASARTDRAIASRSLRRPGIFAQ
jgi:hypothetical protein